MNEKHLVNSLPYILGVVAAGTGVQITTDLRASTASTNGKVIHFPPLPYKGEELAIYSLGYLVHEAGHIRSTDFFANDPRLNTPLGKMLVNVLEDIRIERLINAVYPGARRWLNGLTLKFVETKRQGVTDESADLTQVMLRYLQDWLYESVLGYSAVKGIGSKQRDIWQSKVSDEVAREVEKFALRAAWAADTSEVMSCAVEIIHQLKTEQQSASQQAQQGQQGQPGQDRQEPQSGASEPNAGEDGSSSQEDDQATGSPGESAQEEPGDSTEQDSGGAASSDDSGPAEPNPSGTPGSTGETDDDGSNEPQSSDAGQVPAAAGADSGDSSPEDASKASGTPQAHAPQSVDLQAYADALNELLNTPEVEQGQDRGNALQELIADAVGVSAAKRESTFVLPKVMLTLKGGGDAESITRVRAASIALRYRMDEFLEASKKTRRRASEKGKRLVRDAGIRLALGDTRLYEKRTPGQKVDTAVHVLLDISGSMIKEGRCKIALDAALALGIALQDTDGVSFSLSAFPFHDHDVVDVVLPGELVRDVAKRAALMVPNGTTPLDKGLLHAHTLLMTTPATRRVCMVVTDGQPDDLEAVKLLIEMGQADGIEYLGIGIRSPAQHITPNACLVTDLEDLPKQVIAMMQDVILLPKAA